MKSLSQGNNKRAAMARCVLCNTSSFFTACVMLCAPVCAPPVTAAVKGLRG